MVYTEEQLKKLSPREKTYEREVKNPSPKVETFEKRESRAKREKEQGK